MAEAEHMRGSVVGTEVRQVVGVRSRGPGSCARTLGPTLSETENHQRVFRDMICLESLKGVLLGAM